MARRPNLTQEQLDEIRQDYENWNPYAPGAESAEELAARHGITKTTLYTWRRRGWRLDGRDGDGKQGWKDRNESVSPDPEPEDLSLVVRFLTAELVEARARIAELEAKQ